MRIGIGVTTYNRPECLKECLDKIEEHTNGYKMHIAKDTDEDRRGVAYRKNECLRALKDCDYVFLFDDDCFPIKDGWVDYFVTHGGDCHLLYLNEQHNLTMRLGNCEIYRDCGGVFMYLTKKHIEKVGAFNEKFEKYGFEHAEYSMRINGAKQFYCLNRTSDYIFAHDYSTPNHKSSITDEEKKECIKNNWDKFFKCEIKNIYLPL